MCYANEGSLPSPIFFLALLNIIWVISKPTDDCSSCAGYVKLNPSEFAYNVPFLYRLDIASPLDEKLYMTSAPNGRKVNDYLDRRVSWRNN